MKIEFLCYGALMSNCWAIVEGGEAIVVDAGANADELLRALEERELRARAVVLTHGHFDHVWGMESIAKRLNVPVYVHEADADMPNDGEKNGYMMCYGRNIHLGHADRILKNGDVIPFGDSEIKVIHTPGHSKGSVCYLAGDSLMTGDTLFSNSVGRWDLYGGSVDELRSSLLALTLLDEELTVYPGHGGTARLGDALGRAINLI